MPKNPLSWYTSAMNTFFADYTWVNGRPKGKGEPQADCYKIVKDPYGKRISLERFRGGGFLDCVYDSNLFDFRVLISKVESSWQKIPSPTSTLIVDHVDRTIAEEFYIIKNGLCHECRIHYPKGPLVAIQKMFYTQDNTLSAMVLYDTLMHPACIKTPTFESWDMSNPESAEKIPLFAFQGIAH